MNFNELKELYSKYFSLGYINGDEESPIEARMILISLLCYVYFKGKQSGQNITYQVLIKKLEPNLPDSFVDSLAIVCEDFSYCCTDFPTFGLKGNDILAKIKKILASYLPF